MKKLFILIFGALMILALALGILLSPWATHHLSVGVNQTIYITVRIVLFVALGFLFGRYAGRTRMQALSSLGLVAMLDSLVIVGGAMAFHLIRLPMTEDGMPISIAAVIVNQMLSVMVYLPIILILGFLGYELHRTWRKKPSTEALPSNK